MFQDPDDQLFMPTVRDDVAFGPANLGLRGDELDSRVRRGAGVGRHARPDRSCAASLSFRRSVAGCPLPRCWPCTPILVLDEPSSNLDPASRRELSDILQSLDVTMLMVTHDLPYALELCPRALVLSEGAVVADGPTRTILSDAQLMKEHRLELPFGFDPEHVPAR